MAIIAQFDIDPRLSSANHQTTVPGISIYTAYYSLFTIYNLQNSNPFENTKFLQFSITSRRRCACARYSCSRPSICETPPFAQDIFASHLHRHDTTVAPSFPRSSLCSRSADPIHRGRHHPAYWVDYWLWVSFLTILLRRNRGRCLVHLYCSVL